MAIKKNFTQTIEPIKKQLDDLKCLYQQGYVAQTKTVLGLLNPEGENILTPISLDSNNESLVKVYIHDGAIDEIASIWGKKFSDIPAEFNDKFTQNIIVSIRTDGLDDQSVKLSLQKVPHGLKIEILLSKFKDLQKIDSKEFNELILVIKNYLSLIKVLNNDGYVFKEEDLKLIKKAKEKYKTNVQNSLENSYTSKSMSKDYEIAEKNNKLYQIAYDEYCESYEDLKQQLVNEIDKATQTSFSNTFIEGCLAHQPILETANQFVGEYGNLSHQSLFDLLKLATSKSYSPVHAANSVSSKRDVYEALVNINEKKLKEIRKNTDTTIKDAVLSFKQHGYPLLPEKNGFQIFYQIFMKARRHMMLVVIILGVLGIQGTDYLAKGAFVFSMVLLIAMVVTYLQQLKLNTFTRLKRQHETNDIWNKEIYKLADQLDNIRRHEVQSLDKLLNECRPTLENLKNWFNHEGLALREQWLKVTASTNESSDLYNEVGKSNKGQLSYNQSLVSYREIHLFRQSIRKELSSVIHAQQSLLRRELSNIVRNIRACIKTIKWN